MNGPFDGNRIGFWSNFASTLQWLIMIAMGISNLKTNPRPLSNKFLWAESIWLIRGCFLHRCHIIEDPWNVHWLFESCARSRVLHEKCLNALLRAHMLGFSELFFNGYRKIHRKTPYFMGKSMVSCRFSLSLKPIYWFLLWIGPWDLGGDLHISQTLLLRSFFDLTPNGQILNRLAEDETWQNKNPHNATAAHERCWSAGHQYPWLQLATDDQTSETIGDSSFLLGTFVRVDFFQMNKWHLGVSFTEDVGQHHLAPPAAECDILVTNVLVTSFSHGQVLESSQHRCDLHVGGMVPCQKLVQYTANWSNQCKRLIHSEFFCCANPFRKDFKTHIAGFLDVGLSII